MGQIDPIRTAPIQRLALRREEAAEALGVSDRTLWTWTQQGDIPHVRRGGIVLYPVQALADWLATEAGQQKLNQANNTKKGPAAR